MNEQRRILGGGGLFRDWPLLLFVVLRAGTAPEVADTVSGRQRFLPTANESVLLMYGRCATASISEGRAVGVSSEPVQR